jgi:hypothetical protein
VVTHAANDPCGRSCREVIPSELVRVLAIVDELRGSRQRSTGVHYVLVCGNILCFPGDRLWVRILLFVDGHGERTQFSLEFDDR